MFPLADSKSEQNPFKNLIAIQLYEIWNDKSKGFNWLQFSTIYHSFHLPLSSVPVNCCSVMQHYFSCSVVVCIIKGIYICRLYGMLLKTVRLLAQFVFSCLSVWVHWHYSVLHSCSHSTCFRRVHYMLITAWWRVFCVLCGVMFLHWDWRYRLMWIR
jgi:hypothetical protein